MALTLNYDESALSQKLEQLGPKLSTAVLMYATTKASAIQGAMKVNRPWVDRTGMAKALLNAKVSQPTTETVRITLAHGVEYGIWLELANEKNYAIIAPTIRNEGPRIVEDLGDLLSRIKL